MTNKKLKRINRVAAYGISSSYKKKGRSKERWDISVFKEGAMICPDMFKALQKLDKIIQKNNGILYITDLYRSWEDQSRARQEFLNKKKKAFVAKPGCSFHNAGRAVDISIQELNFQDLDKEEWLQKLWDLAKPIGFRPIISIPDIDASEAWHFDYPGRDWDKAYNKLSYAEIAKCTILDIGEWKGSAGEQLKNMFIQAQLIRLGQFNIGKVDGIIGPKTEDALYELNLGRCSVEDMIDILTNK